MVKNPPANAGDAGDMGLIPGSGRYIHLKYFKIFSFSSLIAKDNEIYI